MKTSICLLAAFLATSATADVADLIREGDRLDLQGKPSEALKFYLPAEKETPDDSTLLIKIAKQYAYLTTELKPKAKALEAARTAVSYSERAVALAPGESDSHLALAVAHGKMMPLLTNKEKVASSRVIKASAEKAVKLNPASDYGWHLLGRWHQGLANVNVVLQGLIRLIYGELPAASNEDALRCFRKAIALKPDRLLHHIEIGRTYALMGRTAEARASLDKGLGMPDLEWDDPETKRRGRLALEKLN